MDYWVTVIIVILIVGITLDGVRRMRISRRENIRLSRNARRADQEPDVPVSSSEFPSGGARVAKVRDKQEAVQSNEMARQRFEAGIKTKGAPKRIPEQVKLNLDAAVPMLMDSVAEEDTSPSRRAGKPQPPKREPTAEPSSATVEAVGDEALERYDDPREPKLGAFANLDDDVGLSAPRPARPRRADEQPPAEAMPPAPPADETPYRSAPPQDGLFADADEDEVEKDKAVADYSVDYDADYLAEEEDEAEASPPRAEPAAETSTQTKAAKFQEPEEVLIINVMARGGERFQGADLAAGLLEVGLKFGDMDIFHRYKDNDGDGPIIFSLANMVVPGTFNLAEMEDFQTPGVSLFLSLPVAIDSLSAYNDMAATAKRLAQVLGGELKDENRSVMTAQTIEHGRQRVIEFERKKKLARA